MSLVQDCGDGVAGLGSAPVWGNTVRWLQLALLLSMAKTMTPLSKPNHPKHALRIPTSSLSPVLRGDLARMAKMVVAGRGQQGDTVAGKNSEAFPGFMVLLTSHPAARVSLALGKSGTKAHTCPTVGFPARVPQSLKWCEKFARCHG